jgi:F0F1-type ATP synthase membrane subunit b/b'
METILKFLNITEREAQGIAFAVPIFFLYWKLLNAYVVKHFVALFEEREALTTGAQSASHDTYEEAKKITAQTEAKIHQARVQANQRRNDEILEAKNAAFTIVQEAEKEAANHVHKTRASLDAELKLLNGNIEQTVNQLANELAAKIQKPTSSAVQIFALILSASVFSILISTPSFAFASEGHSAGHHSGTPADLIPFAVNFFIFISLLIHFTKKPIADAWSNRLNAISTAVSKGRTEMEQAQKILSTAKARAGSVETEIERIKFEISKGAKTESQELLKDAHERALRVRQQGKSLAEGDINHTKEEYRTKLSKLVVEKATELLTSQVTESSDQVLRKNALNQFEGRVNTIIQ